MKANSDIVLAFYNGEQAENRSMTSTGNKLYSYSTCIAQKLANGKIIVNKTKYSAITNKHQYLLHKGDYEVENVPINSINLVKYCDKL